MEVTRREGGWRWKEFIIMKGKVRKVRRRDDIMVSAVSSAVRRQAV